jgi:hypothetical protein
MIVKKGSKFQVTTEDGSRVLGTHPNKESARRQLAAIEISKAKRMAIKKIGKKV